MENYLMGHTNREYNGRFAFGNRYWESRSRHGKERMFTTPEALWNAACRYFEWSETNPLIEIRYVGGDFIKVEIPKMRPFTKKGFSLFHGAHSGYFWDLKKNADPEMRDTITRIEEAIYEQKFTGAAAGFLKENIIMRELGLKDKKKMEVPDRISVSYTGMEEEYV